MSQDKAHVVVTPKQGASVTQVLSLKSSFNDSDVNVTVTSLTTTKSVEKDEYSLLAKLTDVKVEVGGNEMALPYEDINLTLSNSGEVKKITGGLQGPDIARLYLLTHFVPPTTDLAPSEKYSIKFEASKDSSIPAHTFDGVYVGTTDFEGKPALKFTAKYSEPGKESTSADIDFVVQTDGTVLQATSKFKNLPVPSIGVSLDGTVKLNTK